MSNQIDLFGAAPELETRPTALGDCAIAYRQASSILTPASGFMGAYDYTLNPYAGCSFGCTYCYAAFFSRNTQLRDNWGRWVTVKENALALMRKKKPRALDGKKIYMSSVTDPYQPIERTLKLTRSLLAELSVQHQPRLVIQTRSPDVTRDLDLLAQFDNVQVNMTVTTDSEAVRRAFEPACPNNRVRLKAIQQVAEAGIDACITLTPLLPLNNAKEFALQLQETGVTRFIVQPFHTTRGKFIAGTREAAEKIIDEYHWDDNRHNEVFEILRLHLPQLGVGKDGFAPPI
jgi:DNA repair photolyase